MPTTIQVQTDHYTDDGSHPVKFLIDNEISDILSWQISEDLDRGSIRHEFDCVFFDGIEGWQLLAPKTLCMFIGRVVLHREDDLHSWWAFKGEVTTVEIPGWGEL